MNAPRKNRAWMIFGALAVTLLAAAIFTLGSLNVPFKPSRASDAVVLFALSAFIFLAFIIFSLVLTRSLLRLLAERRAGQMGARFKTKMVLGAMGISLLPVAFLFFVSYQLMNRTLGKWFPLPLEIATQQSKALQDDMRGQSAERLNSIARSATAPVSRTRGLPDARKAVENARVLGAEDSWAMDASGKPSVYAIAGFKFPDATPAWKDLPETRARLAPRKLRPLDHGISVWEKENCLFMAVETPVRDGILVVGRMLPDDFLVRTQIIEDQTNEYTQQSEHLRALKNEMLLSLSLVTLVLLFCATWMALFLSKQVTVPIQALAQATEEIARGNLDYRVTVQAQDELGTLVASFNQMTSQLGEGHRQINDFTRSLQLAVEELERRRKLTEAILESIPTGVLSLDSSGEIIRTNSAAVKMFGDAARDARALENIAGAETAREILQLMRKSLRMGAASRELEIPVGGRLMHAAVTVSSLGPRSANPGFVVVIDDVTEVLRAQKAAAWQEVAQRIAHEIKNPLTPIQLSAQRLRRHLERSTAGRAGSARTDFESVVAECASLIEREVMTLKTLVDEFSQFARFPAAKLSPADPNAIVSSALEIFRGRLEGIQLEKNLAASLPAVKADAELLRRVVVNLIDNAADAMEGAKLRVLRVVTRADRERDSVEIEIADSGHGISPEDKDKLFFPHFSTKDRGTGLGLAIASRIVAEHNGALRVEDNLPCGARFVIRLPAAEVAVVSAEPR